MNDRKRRAKPSARDALALTAARASGRLIRALRLGAGETVPGRVAARVSPSIGHSLASGLRACVVVSGTNGKTTTSSMIRSVAEANGLRCATSKSGSNMAAGVVGGLIAWPEAQIGIFEVDEAALPGVVTMVQPGVCVLTNVFRDQLDRFGEPERVVALFRESASRLPPDARLILNADDPGLTTLEGAHLVRFGVDAPGAPHVSGGEPEVCPVCSGTLTAVARTIAHLGVFSCAHCGWRTPERDVRVALVENDGFGGMTVEVGGSRAHLVLGGEYNAYNVAAAVATCDALGFDRAKTLEVLSAFRPRFGRQERMIVGGRPVFVVLVKNPAGADAVLSGLSSAGAAAVVVAVNDNAADGRDVSWIWDVGFEMLQDSQHVVASGVRAHEVALRLSYAGVAVEKTEPDLRAAVRAAIESSHEGPVLVLATYTAMLQLRAAFMGRAAAVVDADA